MRFRIGMTYRLMVQRNTLNNRDRTTIWKRQNIPSFASDAFPPKLNVTKTDNKWTKLIHLSPPTEALKQKVIVIEKKRRHRANRNTQMLIRTFNSIDRSIPRAKNGRLR